MIILSPWLPYYRTLYTAVLQRCLETHALHLSLIMPQAITYMGHYVPQSHRMLYQLECMALLPKCVSYLGCLICTVLSPLMTLGDS